MSETRRISLFPLPSSVFYPRTQLPLHIFEPRYRQMVADAIEAEQWIGMVVLEPGYEEEYYGRPPVKVIGCAGRIEKHVHRPDGKYDIVLMGESRFRIVSETGDRMYREAEVELLPNLNDQPIDKNPGSAFYTLASHFWEIRQLLPEDKRQSMELDVDGCRSLGDVTDRMAYGFDLTLEQKQAFLEECDVMRRMEALEEILRLKKRIVMQSSRFARQGMDGRLKLIGMLQQRGINLFPGNSLFPGTGTHSLLNISRPHT